MPVDDAITVRLPQFLCQLDSGSKKTLSKVSAILNINAGRVLEVQQPEPGLVPGTTRFANYAARFHLVVAVFEPASFAVNSGKAAFSSARVTGPSPNSLMPGVSMMRAPFFSR